MENMGNVNADETTAVAVDDLVGGATAAEKGDVTVEARGAAVNETATDDSAGDLPAPLITPTGNSAGGNAGGETIEQRLGGLFGGDETKTKENANKDARLFSTFRDLEAGEVSRFYALQQLPERVSGAHVSGDIHFHDLDYTVPGGMFNCMLVDLPFILSREDFPIGNTRVKHVRSVETATDLIPQIAAQVSVGQYGGQTYSKIDEVLEPYVMYTYRRELARALENATRVAAEMGVAGVEPLDKSVALLVASGERDRVAAGVGEKIWDMSVSEAKKRTESIVYDSMEGVEYALNTVQGNGQTPFVTISFGLSTSWAGRVVQKAILKVRINGYGAQSKTPVFPKLVYMLKEGVNMRKGDPNYDVKRLALYCASKRIYPDFQSVDNTVRDLGFNPTSMGCFAGDHTVRVKREGEQGYRVVTGEELWSWAESKYGARKQPNGVDECIDVPAGAVQVADSHTGTEQGARVLRLVKNYNNNWVRIKTRDPENRHGGSRSLLVTDNHPLPVEGKGRVFAGDMNVGDIVFRSRAGDTEGESMFGDEGQAWLAGVILCDGCIHSHSEMLVSYADSELEIHEGIVSVVGSSKVRVKRHERGKKGTYNETAIKDSAMRRGMVELFGGVKKSDRSLPAGILNAPRSERVAFLAGMMDADGYIHTSTGEAQLGSVNKSIAYGQLALIESLGIPASASVNRYNKSDQSKSRIAVRFYPTREIIDAIKCDKKKKNYNESCDGRRMGDSFNRLIVSSIALEEYDGPSYDLTTDTDYFDLNGVVSHNCRSFLSYYENPETGEPVEYGRFNVGVVTLNLPRIAMQTENTGEFMRLLDARAEIVREALDWRFDQVRGATASQSPIHYVTGAAGVAMSPSEKVGDLVEGGYATASMGYIGVYEATARFYGGDWYSNREAVEFSVSIVRRLDELARSWKAENGRGYGVYGTPSESLCDRFARLDTRLFGEVEDITSKGYYQNSFHVDVRKNMSPFEKWRVEAQYLPYTTGGAIDYVETETLLKNPDALEAIVDAAVASGVRYFGVNQPVSQCFECDYSGEFAADVRGFYCPDCGERDEEKISVVRRVCGYLGSFADRPVVEGKRKEIVARVKHLRVGDAPVAAGSDGATAVVCVSPSV